MLWRISQKKAFEAETMMEINKNQLRVLAPKEHYEHELDDAQKRADKDRA